MPSPIMLKESTVSTMAMPGGIARKGCTASFAAARPSNPPHDGTADSRPMPRKLSIDSMMIAEPVRMAPWITSGPMRLGRICRNRIATSRSPDTFAASMYGFPRSVRVMARDMRAKFIAKMMPMASMSAGRPRPRIAITATATSRPGRASRMSTKRVPIRSHQPPR